MLGDSKFYNVGQELYEDKSKPNKFNILNDLNIFPTAGNPCTFFRIEEEFKTEE